MASLPAHRRRSLSASTSSPRSPDRILPTKRAYPNFVHDPYLLDADTWRQSKRRRSHSPPLESVHNPTSVATNRHSSSIPPTTTFASTPAEFRLFPKRVHGVQRPYHDDSTPTLDSFSFGLSASKNFDLATLTSLRSNAFGELHRTVTESGEGLIQRMRDYELSRSKSDIHSKVAKHAIRGRKQSFHDVLSQETLSQSRQLVHGDDDDEEVQILLPQMSFPRSPRHKKRAVSLGPSDDILSLSTGSERCFSTAPYPRLTYHSDDGLHVSGVRSPSLASSSASPHQLPTSSTPALSHTLSNSTNSSLVSLALPPSIPHNQRQSPQPGTSSTRTEKAIAALTLAMANGAGDLTDYQALLAIQTTPAVDSSQVGEMWH